MKKKKMATLNGQVRDAHKTVMAEMKNEELIKKFDSQIEEDLTNAQVKGIDDQDEDDSTDTQIEPDERAFHPHEIENIVNTLTYLGESISDHKDIGLRDTSPDYLVEEEDLQKSYIKGYHDGLVSLLSIDKCPPNLRAFVEAGAIKDVVPKGEVTLSYEEKQALTKELLMAMVVPDVKKLKTLRQRRRDEAFGGSEYRCLKIQTCFDRLCLSTGTKVLKTSAHQAFYLENITAIIRRMIFDKRFRDWVVQFIDYEELMKTYSPAKLVYNTIRKHMQQGRDDRITIDNLKKEVLTDPVAVIFMKDMERRSDDDFDEDFEVAKEQFLLRYKYNSLAYAAEIIKDLHGKGGYEELENFVINLAVIILEQRTLSSVLAGTEKKIKENTYDGGTVLELIDKIKEEEKKAEEGEITEQQLMTSYTGITNLDSVTGGLNALEGDTMLVTGRSGTGKSLFLQRIARYSYFSGRNVLHISLEEGVESVVKRFVKMDDLIKQELESKFGKLPAPGKYMIAVTSFNEEGLTMDAIEGKVKEFICKQGATPDILVIDYLDLVDKGRAASDQFAERSQRQIAAQSFRALCNKYQMAGYTATQASDVVASERENDKFVLTRSNIALNKNLLESFSIHITLNATTQESNNNTMRLYVDKNRKGKANEVVQIKTAFPVPNFLDAVTMQGFYSKAKLKTKEVIGATALLEDLRKKKEEDKGKTCEEDVKSEDIVCKDTDSETNYSNPLPEVETKAEEGSVKRYYCLRTNLELPCEPLFDAAKNSDLWYNDDGELMMSGFGYAAEKVIDILLGLPGVAKIVINCKTTTTVMERQLLAVAFIRLIRKTDYLNAAAFHLNKDEPLNFPKNNILEDYLRQMWSAYGEIKPGMFVPAAKDWTFDDLIREAREQMDSYKKGVFLENWRQETDVIDQLKEKNDNVGEEMLSEGKIPEMMDLYQDTEEGKQVTDDGAFVGIDPDATLKVVTEVGVLIPNGDGSFSLEKRTIYKAYGEINSHYKEGIGTFAYLKVENVPVYDKSKITVDEERLESLNLKVIKEYKTVVVPANNMICLPGKTFEESLVAKRAKGARLPEYALKVKINFCRTRTVPRRKKDSEYSSDPLQRDRGPIYTILIKSKGRWRPTGIEMDQCPVFTEGATNNYGAADVHLWDDKFDTDKPEYAVVKSLPSKVTELIDQEKYKEKPLFNECKPGHYDGFFINPELPRKRPRKNGKSKKN